MLQGRPIKSDKQMKEHIEKAKHIEGLKVFEGCLRFARTQTDENHATDEETFFRFLFWNRIYINWSKYNGQKTDIVGKNVNRP